MGTRSARRECDPYSYRERCCRRGADHHGDHSHIAVFGGAEDAAANHQPFVVLVATPGICFHVDHRWTHCSDRHISVWSPCRCCDPDGRYPRPTDPVLASDVQVENPYQLGALRFGLTSEAGLNDGSAFPFVLLGLVLLTKPAVAADLWRWFGLDFCWGTFAGLAVGFGVAALVGNYVLHLRTVHRTAVGLGYFLAPGLIALSYAVGELAHGYGFLSVFACAVTLRWLEMKSATPGKIPELPLIAVSSDARYEAAVDPSTAPLFLVELLLQFTDQLEQIGELVIVVIVGALLTPATFAGKNIADLLLLFFIIRPLAILVGLASTPLGSIDKAFIGWFGIRGIGSLYYLVYAIQHGLPQSRTEAIASTVLATIAISVAMHGITVTPLMNWYRRRQEASSS